MNESSRAGSAEATEASSSGGLTEATEALFRWEQHRRALFETHYMLLTRQYGKALKALVAPAPAVAAIHRRPTGGSLTIAAADHRPQHQARSESVDVVGRPNELDRTSLLEAEVTQENASRSAAVGAAEQPFVRSPPSRAAFGRSRPSAMDDTSDVDFGDADSLLRDINRELRGHTDNAVDQSAEASNRRHGSAAAPMGSGGGREAWAPTTITMRNARGVLVSVPSASDKGTTIARSVPPARHYELQQAAAQGPVEARAYGDEESDPTAGGAMVGSSAVSPPPRAHAPMPAFATLSPRTSASFTGRNAFS